LGGRWGGRLRRPSETSERGKKLEKTQGVEVGRSPKKRPTMGDRLSAPKGSLEGFQGKKQQSRKKKKERMSVAGFRKAWGSSFKGGGGESKARRKETSPTQTSCGGGASANKKKLNDMGETGGGLSKTTPRGKNSREGTL